jgi:hypothetical protein
MMYKISVTFILAALLSVAAPCSAQPPLVENLSSLSLEANQGLRLRSSWWGGRVQTPWARHTGRASAALNLPYMGLGYIPLGAQNNWGFWADLGILSLSPGKTVRLGRGLDSTQNLDDMVRELRNSPLIQFSVSYSF